MVPGISPPPPSRKIHRAKTPPPTLQKRPPEYPHAYQCPLLDHGKEPGVLGGFFGDSSRGLLTPNIPDSWPDDDVLASIADTTDALRGLLTSVCTAIFPNSGVLAPTADATGCRDA